MKKFVMLDAHTLPEADYHQEREILAEAGYECVIAQCKTMDEVVDCCSDADVIGDVYFKIDDMLLSKLPKLQAVIRYGIGYDVVDIEAAGRRGVAVCNLPTYCVEDVASHALGLILDLRRKLTLYDRRLHEGQWDPGYGYEMHRFSSTVLGLMGFGRTARILAGFAKGLGMKVLASDPYLPAAVFREHGVEPVSYEEIYIQADIISLHVPATEETKHLICRETIGKMKDGVMIVNTSRGSIINLQDLMDALDSGKVAAVGLDVMEGEPISDKNARLFQFEQAVVTPHVAYSSAEASDEQHTQAAQTAVHLLRGERPENIVNKKQLGL